MQRHRIGLAAAIIACCGAAARGQFGPPPDVPPPGPPPAAAPESPFPQLPRFERLASGLRICIVEDHALPLVNVLLGFAVGSAADPPDRAGLCHLAATLLEQRSDAHLQLRALGAAATVSTGRDAVWFSSVGHPGQVEALIGIEAARLVSLIPASATGPGPEGGAGLRAAAVASALHAAARTFPDGQDPAAAALERRALAALFPHHTFCEPPTFVSESLGSLAPAELDAFLCRWFMPANATLFIIGDVSEVAVLDFARRQFEGLPYRDRPKSPEFRPLAADDLKLDGPGAPRPGIDLFCVTPPLGAFQSAAIEVLLQRLCNPVDGPLALAARDAGLAPPRFRHEPGAACGVLWLSLDTPPAWSGDAAALLDEVLARAADQPATEIAHNRARALATAAAENRRAAFHERTTRLAAFELVAGDILLAAYERPQLGQVSVDDVRAAAEFLCSTRRVLIRRRQSVDATPASSPTPAAGTLPAAYMPPPADWPDPAAMLTRLAPHAIAAVSPAESLRTPLITLDGLANGVRIVECNVPGLRRVCVRTVLDELPAAGPGLAALMSTGTARQPISATLDYLSYHGIELAAINESPACLSAIGPAELVPQMLEIQALLLREPRRPTDAADPARPGRGITPADLSDPCRVPFGAPLAADVPATRRALAVLESPCLPRIIVVGDVGRGVVAAAVAAAWADWSLPAAATSQAPAEAESTAAAAPATPGMPARPMRVLLNADETVQFSGFQLEFAARPGVDSCAARAAAFIQMLFDPAPPLSRAAPLPTGWAVDCRGESLWFATAVGDPQLVAAVTRTCERVEALRAGSIDPAQAAVALRLADARRWLQLDSAAAIAAALTRATADPWSRVSESDADAAELLRTIRERGWLDSATVRVRTGNDEVRRQLAQLPWFADPHGP